MSVTLSHRRSHARGCNRSLAARLRRYARVRLSHMSSKSRRNTTHFSVLSRPCSGLIAHSQQRLFFRKIRKKLPCDDLSIRQMAGFVKWGRFVKVRRRYYCSIFTPIAAISFSSSSLLSLPSAMAFSIPGPNERLIGPLRGICLAKSTGVQPRLQYKCV